MNQKGNPETLVAAHPANLNAVKYGVHSERLILARAAEIEAELAAAYDFSPTQRLAVHEVARNMSILEAIDQDIDDRGFYDKRGKPRYLLEYRTRVSRQLERWLAKIEDEIERQSRSADPPRGETEDYIRELQRIALGHDTQARAQDRLVALRQLIGMGIRGTTGYLETPRDKRLDYRIMNPD